MADVNVSSWFPGASKADPSRFGGCFAPEVSFVFAGVVDQEKAGASLGEDFGCTVRRRGESAMVGGAALMRT